MGEFKIQTAQNVSINQKLAGIGERIIAYIIDISFLFLFYITIIYLYVKSGLKYNFSSMVFIAILTLPHFLYFPLIQYWNNGQSLGKQIMKIKIVKSDNSHPRLIDFIIRWIFRLFEINTIPGLAIIFMLFNEKKQRLGDIVAKTTVISEKNKIKLTQSIFKEIENDYKPVFLSVRQLSDNDIQLIKNIFVDAKKTNNKDVIHKLVIKVEKILNIYKPEEMSDIKFINTVLKDYNYYFLN